MCVQGEGKIAYAHLNPSLNIITYSDQKRHANFAFCAILIAVKKWK